MADIINKQGLFGSNIPGLLDKGIASLYDRDALVGLENEFGSQYGVQNTASGLASDARHMAAMNNLSNTLSNSGLGIAMGLPSEVAGDVAAFGAGLINEIPALARGFNKQNLGEIVEDIQANYAGSFGTPNTATARGIYEDVFSRATPQEIATMRGGPFANYGTAQAAGTTANTGYNYGYNEPAAAATIQDLGFIEAAPEVKEAIYQDRIMNPNLPGFAVQPSRFQNFRNQVSNQISGLKDFLPFGPKSLTGMAARGIGSMLSNIAPRSYGYSQRTYDAMTPSQQDYVDDLYDPGGLLQGYNKISAFGRGPLGTLANRLGTIQNTLAKQKVKSKVLQQREQQISNAINETINRGEREALSDRNRSVDYGVTGGPTRTDIDVADGGAESGGRGKIVCTMMNESYGFGNFRNKIWLKHSRDLPKEYEVGYHTIFLPLVKFAKGKGKLNKTVKKILEHIARHRTYDLKQEMKGKTHLLGRAYRKVLEPLCFITGKIKSALGRG